MFDCLFFNVYPFVKLLALFPKTDFIYLFLRALFIFFKDFFLRDVLKKQKSPMITRPALTVSSIFLPSQQTYTCPYFCPEVHTDLFHQALK